MKKPKTPKPARKSPATKHATMKHPPILDPLHGWVLWSFGQKKVIGAHYTEKPLGDDFLCHGSVPITMYDNRTPHPDAAKLEEVRKEAMELVKLSRCKDDDYSTGLRVAAKSILGVINLNTPSRAGRRKG